MRRRGHLSLGSATRLLLLGAVGALCAVGAATAALRAGEPLTLSVTILHDAANPDTIGEVQVTLTPDRPSFELRRCSGVFDGPDPTTARCLTQGYACCRVWETWADWKVPADTGRYQAIARSMNDLGDYEYSNRVTFEVTDECGFRVRAGASTAIFNPRGSPVEFVPFEFPVGTPFPCYGHLSSGTLSLRSDVDGSTLNASGNYHAYVPRAWPKTVDWVIDTRLAPVAVRKSSFRLKPGRVLARRMIILESPGALIASTGRSELVISYSRPKTVIRVISGKAVYAGNPYNFIRTALHTRCTQKVTIACFQKLLRHYRRSRSDGRILRAGDTLVDLTVPRT